MKLSQKMEEYGIEIVRLTDEQRATYAKSIQELQFWR